MSSVQSLDQVLSTFVPSADSKAHSPTVIRSIAAMTAAQVDVFQSTGELTHGCSRVNQMPVLNMKL
ncbi:hypothetical protein PLA106_28051 [Pseudomonas amygdali pv. lachrymans str. M302278]|nr:hypothetical protein PLA106_28051 [Pseudomonas amygdali pv. lachrymans str. M302278]